MPVVSLETSTLLVQTALLIGAVTDGLAVIPMLSRRVGTALFGGDPSREDAEYRYAMGIGAALMAGWTVLLLWAAGQPIERRDVLLLTLVPVTGIVVSTVVAVRRRVVLRSRMVPLWVHLGCVSSFYVVAYVLASPFVR